MKMFRLVLLVIILASGIALVCILAIAKIQTPVDSTFAPAFQILGIAPKTINSTLTRLLPLSEIDEKEFGESLASDLDAGADTSDLAFIRLNSIMNEISVFAKKPFTYRVYVEDWDEENAFALPGGIVVMTRSLYSILDRDSEIVAILSHEMGHIELGHCFDAVRTELLDRKGGKLRLAQIMGAALDFLLGHSYSKYEENQADDYAFELLVSSDYDPEGLASSFRKLASVSVSHPENADIIRDYTTSHPPLPIRIEKYEELALQWKNSHKGETRKQ